MLAGAHDCARPPRVNSGATSQTSCQQFLQWRCICAHGCVKLCSPFCIAISALPSAKAPGVTLMTLASSFGTGIWRPRVGSPEVSSVKSPCSKQGKHC
jgi:hypothetical protein